MDQIQFNSIVSFIWGIADDCLRDVYVRGYPFKKISLIAEYRNSLISASITGAVDVRGLVIEDVVPEDVTFDDEEAGEDLEKEATEAESED